MMLALSDYIVYHRKKDVKGRWRVLTMEKKNLSQQTMERLYNTIVAEKRMQPGDKLPNELELSEQLGVSRATLREALRMLIARGVLEVRRGKGTFVSERVEEIENFGFSDVGQLRGQLRDLFELREIFEPGAARLACRRATEEELAEILQCGARGPHECGPGFSRRYRSRHPQRVHDAPVAGDQPGGDYRCCCG